VETKAISGYYAHISKISRKPNVHITDSNREGVRGKIPAPDSLFDRDSIER
jgi:hypothetical protein